MRVNIFEMALAACLGLIGLVACAAPQETAVKTRSIGLYAGPAPYGTGDRVGSLRFLAGFEIVGGDDRLGGLSGMTVAPDGGGVLAVSDRGDWVRLGFEIRDGLPSGLADVEYAPLANQAEAILALDGNILVAFEEDHRVDIWRTSGVFDGFPGWAGAPPSGSMPLPDAVQDAGGNSGIEAMARLTSGYLLIFLEGEAEPNDRQAARQGWIVGETGYRPLTLETAGGFRPTDAATLPDGDVLVLLRCWASCGFRSEAKIVRLAAGDIVAGARLTGETIAHLAAPMNVDNYEGLAVRRDEAGRTLVYLLSDDNFNPRQRSLFMLFALDEPLDDQG